MTFPIYGKIKNGNQTTNQQITFQTSPMWRCPKSGIAQKSSKLEDDFETNGDDWGSPIENEPPCVEQLAIANNDSPNFGYKHQGQNQMFQV